MKLHGEQENHRGRWKVVIKMNTVARKVNVAVFYSSEVMVSLNFSVYCSASFRVSISIFNAGHRVHAIYERASAFLIRPHLAQDLIRKTRPCQLDTDFIRLRDVRQFGTPKIRY